MAKDAGVPDRVEDDATAEQASEPAPPPGNVSPLCESARHIELTVEQKYSVCRASSQASVGVCRHEQTWC